MRQLEGPHVDHDGGGGGDGDESSKMLEGAHDGWVVDFFGGGRCRVGVDKSSMNTRGKPRGKNILLLYHSGRRGVNRERKGMRLFVNDDSSDPTSQQHHNMAWAASHTREGVTRDLGGATSSGNSKSPQVFDVLPGKKIGQKLKTAMHLPKKKTNKQHNIT